MHSTDQERRPLHPGRQDGRLRERLLQGSLSPLPINSTLLERKANIGETTAKTRRQAGRVRSQELNSVPETLIDWSEDRSGWTG